MNEIEIKWLGDWMIISQSSDQQIRRWINTVDKILENEKPFRENNSQKEPENIQKILL